MALVSLAAIASPAWAGDSTKTHRPSDRICPPLGSRPPPPAEKPAAIPDSVQSERIIRERYDGVGVRVYRLIDGERTAEDILNMTGLSSTKLVEILNFMNAQGIIKIERSAPASAPAAPPSAQTPPPARSPSEAPAPTPSYLPYIELQLSSGPSEEISFFETNWPGPSLPRYMPSMQITGSYSATGNPNERVPLRFVFQINSGSVESSQILWDGISIYHARGGSFINGREVPTFNRIRSSQWSPFITIAGTHYRIYLGNLASGMLTVEVQGLDGHSTGTSSSFELRRTGNQKQNKWVYFPLSTRFNPEQTQLIDRHQLPPTQREGNRVSIFLPEN